MFSDPRNNILHAHLMPGMVVADIGAGAGEYTRVASALVGETGKVYAIDVQKEMLGRLKEISHLSNVDTIWGNVEVKGGTRLRDNSIDVCILANTLFQLDQKQQGLEEIKRILKPGGILMIIDWKESFGNMGPHTTAIVSLGQAIELCTQVGFRRQEDFDAGPHHYGCIVIKN